MWPPRSCLWLALVLCLLLVGVAQGQSSSREHFEDADKSSEYTDQQYDLRHTIPGEPGLDYPILSAPPKTSFVCKGRHEGYYADVESRCQAFRICAHTARIPQGFGFLCPNGTLFSQKNFVCDWYRNVNCDDSERYYEMNEEKSVGNTHEMMERVRHMMEYPMKTISKALQQTQSQSQNPHHSLSKDLSGASGVLSQPAVVKSNDPQETQVVGRGEAVKSEPLNAVKAGITTTDENEDEGIYVNSLGELSSDPGIQFDHTNAHIVAEYPREYHYQKQKNFAERVNAGLDVLTDTETPYGEVMAPDYIKHIRNTKDEAVQLDLVSNINNLLDEVSTDVDPSVSGYQSMAPPKVKQPFRFLSRGFSMQGENGKGSSSSTGYGYIKPKQTPSTVRFTNFKSAQSQGSHQQQQQQQHQQQRQQQHQAVKQQHHSVSSSYVKPAAAPAISSLTVPPRPQQAAQVSELPPPPGIVIARAEGQRIAPNSASNIISSLATQAPVTNGQSNSYVSLNDFLNNKFGQSPASSNNIAPAATLQQHQQQHYQQQRVQKQPVQQQHVQLQQRQSVQQQQRQPIQQQHLAVQQQQQPVQQQHQQQLSFISQQYQQPQQHNAYQQYQQPQQQHQRFQQQQHFQQRPTIHTNQQPYLTPNIFVPYQQQQQQLPQFPPLAPPVAVSPGNIAQGPVIAGRHVDHLNVQLPTLGNGLIPGLQLAQKRSDVSASQLQLTDAPGKGSLSGSGKSRERAFYAGRTSYEVPQSSVGRLPNDVTQQMRRRLRRF
ncbi:RNA polymerase II degradation factor 1 isoform X2 [Drosophila elegans]|uniref:RNA polymerase II degradation factor 1 isoform X2 n=1 Tax=Drosophila elegans TaxID=30023 RepID=UPI0007E71A0E|nr:RNA polymerase II degradation factor 1 isoform X2 [Drosophila elegans]